MLCDICHKNKATVHLTEIINDQMTELHLCEGCARQKSSQMEQHFGLADILAGLSDFGKQVTEAEGVGIKCPNCGLTYADFKKIGRFGCSKCYVSFKQYLEPLLKKIHGSTQHIGKTPRKVAVTMDKPINELQNLKLKLQKAIQLEEFEEAAALRDKIRELEKKSQKKGNA